MNAPAAPRLKITEIFVLAAGRGRHRGLPDRLRAPHRLPAALPLLRHRLRLHGGEWMSLDEMLTACAPGHAPRLRHRRRAAGAETAFRCCAALCDAGCEVSLETSGALGLPRSIRAWSRVVDVKTPGLRRTAQPLDQLAPGAARPGEVRHLRRADYEWSRADVREPTRGRACMVLFSPSHDQLAARELAEWILADNLPVRCRCSCTRFSGATSQRR
jgi:7-carboxy-7-deazaguanine synthase